MTNALFTTLKRFTNALKAISLRRETALSEIKAGKLSLGQTSADMRENREVALAAVKKNYADFRYASEALQKDRDMRFAVVYGSGATVWGTMPKELAGNREFVLEAVTRRGGLLEFADEILRADREIVLEAVSNDGTALRWADHSLKVDRKIVQKAASNVRKNVNFAWVLPGKTAALLRSDKETVLEGVKKIGCTLQFASPKLRKDRDIVSAAVKNDGEALDFTTKKLKNDREIVRIAMKQNSSAFVFASKEIQTDEEFVRKYARKYDKWYKQIIKEASEADVLGEIERDAFVINFVSAKMAQDVEFLAKAVGQNARCLWWIPKKLHRAVKKLVKANKIDET